MTCLELAISEENFTYNHCVLDGYVASRSEIVNLVAGDNLLMLRRKFAETKGRNI